MAYNATAAYCAGLTGIRPPDAFYDVRGQLSPAAREYLSDHGEADNAFTGAAMGAMLKDFLPPKIYLALHHVWWVIFDDPRAEDAPSKSDLMDIAKSFD